MKHKSIFLIIFYLLKINFIYASELKVFEENNDTLIIYADAIIHNFWISAKENLFISNIFDIKDENDLLVATEFDNFKVYYDCSFKHVKDFNAKSLKFFNAINHEYTGLPFNYHSYLPLNLILISDDLEYCLRNEINFEFKKFKCNCKHNLKIFLRIKMSPGITFVNFFDNIKSDYFKSKKSSCIIL